MVKTQFGIKDLENLSNVKAHTIRIWEKRYNLLEPDRTDTNIRKYDLKNLKKLLNVAYLYHAGHKISKIASLDDDQIRTLVKKNSTDLDSAYMLNVFKSAMFEFDGGLFDTTLESLLEKKSFGAVFSEIFVPLLTNMGILWHSGTIDPSHEHFISEKIKHSIIGQTAKLKKNQPLENKPLFALYLPYQETHEIGLLYANYELMAAGFETLFLGANIPLQSLEHVLNTKNNLVFVTYFTVYPETDSLKKYLNNFQKIVNRTNSCELWVLGKKIDKTHKNTKNLKFFKDPKQFTDHVLLISNT